MLETPNANLASPEKPSPSLSAETLNKLIESNAESRPWGSFTVLEEGPGYKIKRIVVLPKHRLSLQLHYHRSEHWIVVAGTAKVTCGDEEKLITANQSTYVPPLHQASPGEPWRHPSGDYRGAKRPVPGRRRHCPLQRRLRPC